MLVVIKRIKKRKREKKKDDDDDEELMENTYYGAKSEEDVNEKLEQFNTVLDMEEKKGKWGFKSLKQIIKIHYQKKLIQK